MRLSRSTQQSTSHSKTPSIMRSDNSNLYSAPMSQPVTATQQSRSRPQNPAKPGSSPFHLGSLPRFHPAVYQPQADSHGANPQPQPPWQSRQHSYRPSSPGSRDAMRQYRDLVESATLSRTPSGPLSPGPSAPRLGPLRSPGPVTPLALEESSSYLTAGAVNASEQASSSHQHQGPPADLVIEKLIGRESERVQQNTQTNLAGR